MQFQMGCSVLQKHGNRLLPYAKVALGAVTVRTEHLGEKIFKFNFNLNKKIFKLLKSDFWMLVNFSQGTE